MMTAIIGPAPAAPDYERIIRLAVNAVPSAESQRAYRHGITGYLAFLTQSGDRISKESVQAYLTALRKRGLASASVNLQLSAIKRLATEASDNELLDAQIAGAISRIKGEPRRGRRLGIWLGEGQAQELILAPASNTLAGIRDRALLATLIGCGLRREEVVSLTVGHLQQREGRWVWVDLIGKGKRIRHIPCPAWVYRAVSTWVEAARITEGRIFRRVRRDGRIGQSLTGEAVRLITQRYGDIAPHDLRRTFSKLAHQAGADMLQLQQVLGHASIDTTQKYLGTAQDLVNSPGDLLEFQV